MTVTWLIERGLDDENAVRLVEAAKALGDEVVEVRYVPFGGGLFRAHDVDRLVVYDPRRTYLPVGSMNMIRHLSAPAPGSRIPRPQWCDFEKFRCSTYYAHFGEHLLGDEYVMLPLRELIRRKSEVYRMLEGGDAQVFIRPDENDKRFAGQLVQHERFDEWATSLYMHGNAADGLVVVAAPRRIDAEYRLVVANGKVIASSMYRSRRAEVKWLRGCPPGAVELAETLARTWQPHPIWVADVAEHRGCFELIEIGSIHAAGLYACDLSQVAARMSALARRDDAWTETGSSARP